MEKEAVFRYFYKIVRINHSIVGKMQDSVGILIV